MSFSLLVLHGPNLGKRAAEEIDPKLERRAEELELELTIVQSNGEAGLLDALHEHAESVDAVVVNPGALAPVAYALAEGLQLLALPSVEVLLEAVPLTRGQSSLTSVVKLQIHGEGVEGYVKALEHLNAGRPPEGESKPRKKKAEPAAPSSPRGKTIGRKQAAEAEAPAASPSGPRGKTIGRAKGEEKPAAPKSSAGGVLTRAQVVERIKARLAGTETPEGLAAWSRQQWTALQRGATVESGAKDTIENVLLTLMAGVKASDAVLVAQMAKLDA